MSLEKKTASALAKFMVALRAAARDIDAKFQPYLEAHKACQKEIDKQATIVYRLWEDLGSQIGEDYQDNPDKGSHQLVESVFDKLSDIEDKNTLSFPDDFLASDGLGELAKQVKAYVKSATEIGAKTEEAVKKLDSDWGPQE